MAKQEFQSPDAEKTVPKYLLYSDLGEVEYNPSQLEHVSDLSEYELKQLAERIV